MRILFIQMPWADIHGEYEGLAKVQGFEPPLGICYLAAIAERRGHEVRIIDAEAEQLDKKRQIKKTLLFKPDIVGITSTTPCFHKAVEYAEQLKKVSDIKVMIGGPHISVLQQDAFSKAFDFGVYGEGEKTFEELLEAIENKKKSYSKIKGLMYWKDNKLKKNPPREFINDLDSIDFPARNYLNLDLYQLSIKKMKIVKIATIMAMRGCPFQCVFCASHTMWGRKTRFRSPKNVVDEMELVKKKHGISHFIFNDSTLTLNRKFIEDLCHEILKRKLNITWEGWTRANLIDEKLLKLMKKSGFIRISFGIESGDPKILKLIKKEIALKDVRKAYKLVKKLDIEATCSVMIGHPGETKKSLVRTIKFIKSIPEIRYSPLSIAVPYPGTELFEMASKGEHGIHLLTNDFTKFTRYGNAVIDVNDLKAKDLLKYQKWGMLYIHLTPGRIWYNFWRSGPYAGLKNFYAFLKVFISSK